MAGTLSDFTLPNATTWFYFSVLLMVGLFFKFNRLLSMRNWDLLMLFALVPGFLFLQQAALLRLDPTAKALPGDGVAETLERARGLTFTGYLWLISGSGYWLLRCLADLAIVRRPALSPNLNVSGLAWMTVAMFAFLCVVAIRPNPEEVRQVGRGPVAIEQVQAGAATLVRAAQGTDAEGEAGRATGFWVGRGVALAGHLAVLIALVLIGWRHFGDVTIGVAMAATHVLIPYTAYHVGQAHHILPAALLTWAVLCYRRPCLSGSLIGVAAGSSFFPVLLFPLWLGFYWRRGATRFAGYFLLALALTLALTGLVLHWNGGLIAAIDGLLKQPDWQPWKIPQAESIWTGVHWAYRMPVFVAFAVIWIVNTVWPASKNLAQVVAQSAIILLGIQFWFTDQGGRYVLWYLPLLTLLIFRPNLTEARPAEIDAERAWLRRVGRVLTSRLSRPRSRSVAVPTPAAVPAQTPATPDSARRASLSRRESF